MSAKEPGTGRIDFSDGQWTNEPESVVLAEGVLQVTAVKGSDAWRHTSYGFVHDTEHALLRGFEPGSAVEVEFSTGFNEQFDQAGVFIRASQERWVKAGVEYADGVLQVGAVVTDVNSDWSVAPVPQWLGKRVKVRVSWDNGAMTVRAGVVSEGGAGSLQLVRVLPFAPASGDEVVAAGPMVCAPTRAGLSVEFYDWRAGVADAGLH